MSLNEELLRADLIRDEGLKDKVYRCTAGKLTVGVGRNLDDVGCTSDEIAVMGMTLDELKAGAPLKQSAIMYMLDNDIKRCRVELSLHCPWWVDMPEPCQRGLMNMLFNMGWTRLSGFKKMLGALQAGLWSAAADHAADSAWYGQVGKRAERIEALYRSA